MIPADSITHEGNPVPSRLQEVERELDNLLYSISHDMRTPLRSISGFSEALLEDYAGKLDATGDDYLKRIGASARTLDRMFASVVKLSRISRHVPTAVHVDLSAIGEDILIGHHENDPHRAIGWHVTPGMEIHTDRDLLRLAMEALIDNAWKFTRPKPKADITVKIQPNQHAGIDIVVHDNGVGFDTGIADSRIFVIFQRFHAPGDFPGDGIGLALAQRAAYKLGGTVSCRSSAAEGSTFTLSLPEKIPNHES